jgi:hypothetical protein
MPLPRRTPTETRDKFIERCMSDKTMVNEYPDKTQRLAYVRYNGENNNVQLLKQKCHIMHN